jgi:predicted nuclease with TOPRIM domain
VEQQILEKILTKLDILEAGLDNLKAGQVRLEAGQARLEAGLAKLETRVTKLEAGQARLEGRFDTLEGRFDTLEGRVTKLEEDVAFIRDTALRMEVDHGDQLKALFDGYSLVNARLDRHEVILRRMERGIEALQHKVELHDQLLKAMN